MTRPLAERNTRIEEVELRVLLLADRAGEDGEVLRR